MIRDGVIAFIFGMAGDKECGSLRAPNATAIQESEMRCHETKHSRHRRPIGIRKGAMGARRMEPAQTINPRVFPQAPPFLVFPHFCSLEIGHAGCYIYCSYVWKR
jgi:hypothetical protein